MFVAQSQSIGCAGTEVFDEHIGSLNQFEGDFSPGGGFQIENDAFLVSIEVSKVEAEVRIGGEVPVRITTRRRFDLDDPRAKLSEQRGSVRPGHERRRFYD